MAKINVGKGISEYTKRLSKLYDISRECIGKTVYVGAEVVIDAMVSELRALPVDNRVVKKGEKIKGINYKQKAGLLKGFGVARMQERNDFYNVKLGFAGYNDMKTNKYPGGQPNSVIARSVVAGTTFRQKNDFVGRAIRKSEADANQKMIETWDKYLDALWPSK